MSLEENIMTLFFFQQIRCIFFSKKENKNKPQGQKDRFHDDESMLNSKISA